MTIEGVGHQELGLDREKSLDLNIVCLNHCETISQMVELIENITLQGRIDVVLLGEYNFKINEILSQLKTIQQLAQQKGFDLIMAPDNQFGESFSWGQLKMALQPYEVQIEQTEISDDIRPETVGVFVGRNGLTFAFPKTWNSGKVHRPVHKIPETNWGVTICGEMHEVTPSDLDGITIIFNPSREGDDPYLKMRMLQRHGQRPLDETAVAEILLTEPHYQTLLDDSLYDPRDADYLEELDSRESRERRFNTAVAENLREAANPENSNYIKEIDETLSDRNIPVVRCDGIRSTGVLNQLPGMKIADLEYSNGYTKYNLTLEKSNQ